MPGRLKAAVLWAGALLGGLGVGTLGRPEPPTEITFLAVGQGDSTLIRHGGASILVDAGPADDRFDAGGRIIAPKLREAGVGAIDLLLLTHPDLDHVGGLSGLASRVEIRKVGISEGFRDHPEIKRVLSAAHCADSDVVWLRGTTSLRYGRMRCIIRVPNKGKVEEDNEGSLFVKVDMDGAKAVLTGDAGEETEIVQAGRGDWSASILKAGHHGSAGSTSSAWLEEVKPKVVVVSCGVRNRYGHPAAPAVDRVRRSGAELLRTDRDGDIRFEVRKGRFVRTRP